LGIGEALRDPASADGDRGDGSDRDRGADPHHEGRGDTGPEQPLRQREDQNENGARAGPQAHRDDRRQAALPAAGTGKLLRLRRMRMTPGRSVVVVVMVVMMARLAVMMMVMTMIMTVIMLAVIVRVIMMRVFMRMIVMVVMIVRLRSGRRLSAAIALPR